MITKEQLVWNEQKSTSSQFVFEMIDLTSKITLISVPYTEPPWASPSNSTRVGSESNQY